MIKYLILEIEAGRYQGRKIWLLPDQSVRVGTSAYADYQYETDMAMSGIHCLFFAKTSHSKVRDLNSRVGTFVNGQKINFEHELRNDDIVRVGRTEFRVFLDGWTERSETVDEPVSTVSDPDYVSASLATGLDHYQPNPGRLPIMDVLEHLSAARNGFALIQIDSFSVHSLPTYFSQLVHICDGVGLLPLDSNGLRRQVVQTLFGKQAAIFLYSGLGTDVLAAKIRNLAGIYRDFEVLRNQMEHGQKVFVETICADFDVILFEHENAVGWHMYSKLDCDFLFPHSNACA